MKKMENCRASFDKLRMRGNLPGTKKNLMLSLSKHARCQSQSFVEPGKTPYAIALRPAEGSGRKLF
jgi:hypothetical protein